MTFPATPLPMGVELYIDGAWTDITPYVYSRDSIDVRRGKSSEGGLADPSSMTLTLNNRDGRWSPRNPSGAYYGKIGRNTKVRAWVENGMPRQPLGSGYYFSTPDSAALSITGDIDIRADAWMFSWRPIAPTFIGPFKTGSYGIYVTTAGYLVMYWSADGTNYDTLSSSEPVPGPTTGRRAVRATLDVNNGAGGKTARFYYSDDNTISGTWIEFGSADTTAGTTSIFNSANALLSTFSWRGECYDLEIRNGIGGSIVAKPAFTTRTVGASSFADSYGNTWTGQGGATVSNRHYRFYGEVAEWPQKWDRSGRDVYVPVECSGILRRLGQGNSPVASALFHGTRAIGSALRAYWPFEDSDGSTTMTAGIDGGRVAVVRGTPSLAAYSDFVCSDAIPTVGTGRFYCPVTPYTNTDKFQVRFLLKLSTSIANNTVIARIYTNNTLGWIDVVYQTTSGGQLYLQPYTNLGVATTASGVLNTTQATGVGGGVNSVPLRLDVEASKNGAGVDFLIAELEPEQSTGWTNTGNVASATLGACTQVIINPNGANLGDTAIGHVTVEDTITTVFDLQDELAAYRGEEAVLRAYRILNENSVTSWLAGYGGESELMGYERQASFLALVRECEAADGGVLYEPRQEYGLAYRSLESLFGQAAVVPLDYANQNLQQFEPVDDDRNTRNKVTVTRVDGSSATVEDTTSSMSTQDPPNGVGLYDTSLSLSLSADDQVAQRAGWAVHAGTIDEARWPTISINLAHPDFVADADLTRKVLTADVGDRLTVGNPPSWLPPDDVDQIIIGTNETISQFEHTITFVCEPAATYRSATIDATVAEDVRWDADSSLNGAHNSSTTSLSVALDDGMLWSHGDGDFDIVVGGERITVTAISGTSSPQTFTVTRSVNGVAASHSDGDAVVLFKPTYYIP